MFNHPVFQANSAPAPQATGAPPPPTSAPPPPTSEAPLQAGAPPPSAGAPPQQQGGETKAEVAQVLIQRAKTLSSQESETFFSGITVPALQVLKKILPEIGPAIDGAIAKKQGGGAPPQGGAPMPPAMPPQGGQPMPPQAPPPRAPGSGLRAI